MRGDCRQELLVANAVLSEPLRRRRPVQHRPEQVPLVGRDERP
jgi:hypothetical protein